MSFDEKLILFVVGLVIVGGGSGLWSIIVWSEMVEEVNRKLPPEQRFGLLGWHPRKSLTLIVQYRRLYPKGPLFRRFLILNAASVLLVLSLLAWVLLSPPTS
jgi:hypothetical protein